MEKVKKAHEVLIEISKEFSDIPKDLENTK
jgi:hypothetical protein